jgi:hypothetical protein
MVRHPLERFLSEYKWRQRNAEKPADLTAWARDARARYRNNPFSYDNHLRPQVEFLLDGMRVFRLEEDGISKAIRFAAGELGLADLPDTSDIRRNRVELDYLLTDEVRDICYGLYEKDFDYFSYEH